MCWIKIPIEMDGFFFKGGVHILPLSPKELKALSDPVEKREGGNGGAQHRPLEEEEERKEEEEAVVGVEGGGG